MGCTGEKSYEEAVKFEMRRYLNSFNLIDSRKKEINDYINQDLKKRSIALQNYQYIYREEDVKQTVKDYEILLWENFRVGNMPYEEQQILDKKEINEDKKNNKHILNNNENNNENNHINNKDNDSN